MSKCLTIDLLPSPSPGVFHLWRGGRVGGERRVTSRTGQARQRQTSQVQGPLLQETEVLWRLRAHDSLCVQLVSRFWFPARQKTLWSLQNVFSECKFALVLLFLSLQWTISLHWDARTAKPASTTSVSPTSSSRSVLAKLWAFMLQSATDCDSKCTAGIFFIRIFSVHARLLSCCSLLDSEEPTALLSTAASRTPQSHSCCPFVSPAYVHSSTLTPNQPLIIFMFLKYD